VRVVGINGWLGSFLFEDLKKSRTGWIAFGVYICRPAWGWYLHPGEAQRVCCCPEPQLQAANASTKNCDTKIVCWTSSRSVMVDLPPSKMALNMSSGVRAGNNQRLITYISTLLVFRHSYWRPWKMPPTIPVMESAGQAGILDSVLALALLQFWPIYSLSSMRNGKEDSCRFEQCHCIGWTTLKLEKLCFNDKTECSGASTSSSGCNCGSMVSTRRGPWFVAHRKSSN